MVQKKHKKTFYKVILNSFFKKGKKQKIKKFLDKLFLTLSKEYKISSNKILLILFKKLYTLVEIKKVKIRRRIYLIPFSIRNNRCYYLIIKWLKMAILEDTRYVSFAEKLKIEIKKILSNKKISRTIKLKNLNVLQAFSNRSNIHYRW